MNTTTHPILLTLCGILAFGFMLSPAPAQETADSATKGTRLTTDTGPQRDLDTSPDAQSMKDDTSTKGKREATSTSDRSRFVERYDADNDGKIGDASECAKMKADLMTKYDKDGDGKLTAEEKKAMHEEMDQAWDVNNDGKLSGEEKEAKREAMAKK